MMIRPSRFAAPLLMLAVVGCGDPANQPSLRIASSLARDEARALDEAFAAWHAARTDTKSAVPRLIWVEAAPGIDATQAVTDGGTFDIVLGGSAVGLERLNRASKLEPISMGKDDAAPPSWWLLERPAVGLLASADHFEARAMPTPEGWDVLSDPRMAGLIALDDPRRDPITLALASARLAEGPWAEGYTGLVRAAALALPIGRAGGAARSRLERDDAAIAPASEAVVIPGDRVRWLPLGPGELVGVGVVRGSDNQAHARRFLSFLDHCLGLVRPPEAREIQATSLLADLLGATLVDAQDELVGAARVLDESLAPRSRLEAYLTEAPPWPPASVQELIRTDADGALVEELAGQLTTDLESRVWLLNRWDEPARPIDGERLSELASAVDGSLASEPRFRAWLRAEWTAWARQRDRRVARQARIESRQPSPTSLPEALP